MAGYSSTALAKKLGIKPGCSMFIVNAPGDYYRWIEPLPDGIQFQKKPLRSPVDIIHLFAPDRGFFEKFFKENKDKIHKNGAIWVSWPKRSSGITTDLDENYIRSFGLMTGLVDVKVCAVSDVWSGLKFVYRLVDRKT